MSRRMIATVSLVAAVAVTLSLSACASGGRPSGIQSARPHPTASHGSVTPTQTPTATPTPTSAAPVAALSTTPGDELLTFTGTARSANGSAVALSFTLHSPVAWNSRGGASTLAALAGASRAGVAPDLLDPAWDAAHGVSLAVVDYTVRMTAGTWVVGQNIVMHLGPDQSEVPVSTVGLVLDPYLWAIAGPGSGHFVVAFPNFTGTTPDPSAWGDQLQGYGFDTGLANYDDPNAYQLSDCRLNLTPLGERPAGVPEEWSNSYCWSGVGD
ncbi:MAG: hypothetical protein ABIP33_13100 [Pseudolysinimonas sp.]